MGMPIKTPLLAWPPRHHHQSSPTELLTMGLESMICTLTLPQSCGLTHACPKEVISILLNLPFGAHGCTVPEFAAVKSKIQADPDYVGELPYIRTLNPQYKIKALVHAPPKNGNGKWYQVSRGTAIGVFSNW